MRDTEIWFAPFYRLVGLGWRPILADQRLTLRQISDKQPRRKLAKISHRHQPNGCLVA